MKCEICGKEFVWKNHRFCSTECRHKYIGSQCNKNGKLNGHPQFNKSLKGQWQSKPGGWKCPYCSEMFRTRREKQNHVKTNHPEQQKGFAWNKGLTKETNENVAKNGKAISDNYKSGKSKRYNHKDSWTEEKRKKQSELKKQLYLLHPEKHPNVKVSQNRKRMTYPEQLTFDFLLECGFNPNHNKHIKTHTFNRYVDFYIEELKLIIEIDGEHWHQDKEKDNNKDAEAEAIGYKTLRIKPKHGVLLQLKNFFDNVVEKQ